MQIAKNSLDDALQHKDAGAGGGRRPVRILPLACKKNAKPRFLVERLVTNAKRFANLERGEALAASRQVPHRGSCKADSHCGAQSIPVYGERVEQKWCWRQAHRGYCALPHKTDSA